MIRIVSCSDSARWYHDQVGKTFRVDFTDSEGYWTREPTGFRNVVLKRDAEVIQ